MLKELNRLAERVMRQRAAWSRWHAKMSHNRRGPEPVLPSAFREGVKLPSGRVEWRWRDTLVAEAYRQARRPCASAEEVKALPLGEEEIRRMYAEYLAG